VLAVANEPRFADVPPARIVPKLADEGVYLASESSFAAYCASMARTRIEDAPRRPGKVPAHHPHRQRPASGLVLGHDLPAHTRAGQWFYLYLILDLYSRKIVGWGGACQ